VVLEQCIAVESLVFYEWQDKLTLRNTRWVKVNNLHGPMRDTRGARVNNL
jgi:hypothetical protein